MHLVETAEVIVESSTEAGSRFGFQRLARVAGASLFLVGALAACGGGSSTGSTIVPAPVACDSASASSADGFAIGMCASTKTAVLVNVDSTVAITAPADGYRLTLLFPQVLQANNGITDFTSLNLTPSAWGRNVLGALRGDAYENPLNEVLQVPYTALTDFHAPCCYLDNPPWLPPQLKYVGFGSWERVPTSYEGFVGAWYERPSASVTSQWPIGAADRVYRGYVVGAIGPDEDGAAPSYLDRLRRFSAPIQVTVDGSGRIVTGQIGTISMLSYFDAQGIPRFEDLPLDPIDLVPAGTEISPNAQTGTFASAGGANPDVDDRIPTSRFEARFFGPLGDIGFELAGRLRFRTSNGLIAVGSFGSQYVPVP